MKLRGLLAVHLVLALGGCERGMHDMYDQPKYKPLTPTTLFADGNSSRPQVRGTVPHSAGALAATSSGRNNLLVQAMPVGPAIPADPQGRSRSRGEAAAERDYPNPLPITASLLARGRERFDIYCAPCHSRIGDGNGMVVRRGFPSPPSYHSARLRTAPDGHFYQVISDGFGVMYPYADRLAPADRWAIVAYIRALQLSQNARATGLAPQDRAALSGRTP